MAEYIDRDTLIKALEADFTTDWTDYASKNNFDKDYIDGVRDEYDDVLKIICQQKAADVQPVDRRISIDDICNELAQLIGIPCIFREAEEILLHRCEDCCPRIPDSECWKRYFDTKFSEMLTDTDIKEIANCIEFRKRMKR